MATSAHRDWLTPYEILRGSQPSIAHLQPFWTKAFVQVPKTKRAKMKEWGQPNQRAEIGHLIGFQDLWGSTARVLLDRNRVVHSRNVTYDSKSVTNPTPAPTVDRGEDQSVAERDGIEEIIDGFAAMDITEHSLVREGATAAPASLKEALLLLRKCPWSTLTLAQRCPLPQTLCLRACRETQHMSRHTITRDTARHLQDIA